MFYLLIALLSACHCQDNVNTIDIDDDHEHEHLVKRTRTTGKQFENVPHMIELASDTTAVVNCFSDRGHGTIFVDDNNTRTECIPNLCIPKPDRFDCCILIRQEELPKELTCTTESANDNTNTKIQFTVISKPSSDLEVISVVEKTRYHCLQSEPGPEVLIAGHMLSMGWMPFNPNQLEKMKNETNPDLRFREFSTVTEQLVWRLKKDTAFPCNNSVYVMGYEYGCLELLPWPSSFPYIAMENCSLLHNCGIVVALICIYVLCYTVFCLCVQSCKKMCRRKEPDYWEVDLKSSCSTVNNERYLVRSDTGQNLLDKA